MVLSSPAVHWRSWRMWVLRGASGMIPVRIQARIVIGSRFRALARSPMCRYFPLKAAGPGMGCGSGGGSLEVLPAEHVAQTALSQCKGALHVVLESLESLAGFQARDAPGLQRA